MIARRIPNDELRQWWQQHGVALCAEAQADGVPCTDSGRECETCQMALASWIAAGHAVPPNLAPYIRGIPECGP